MTPAIDTCISSVRACLRDKQNAALAVYVSLSHLLSHKKGDVNTSNYAKKLSSLPSPSDVLADVDAFMATTFYEHPSVMQKITMEYSLTDVVAPDNKKVSMQNRWKPNSV